MMKIKKFETEFAGKTLTVEFSNLADETNGSALVRYGDTVVLATAVMSETQRSGIDYFPLTVDYEEKFYAAGQILGSKFIRREGKPSDEAILVSRLIDRAIRPLFNQKMRNETQITVLALSVDAENDPDIPALIAASLALAVSDIPWAGPIGAMRIGFPDPTLPIGRIVVNPTYAERENLIFEAVITGKDGKINMIEGQGKEAPENVVAEAFEKCLKEMEMIQKFQEKIISEIGKEKIIPEIKPEPEEMQKLFKKHFEKRLEDALYNQNKVSRNSALDELKTEWLEAAKNEFGEEKKGIADETFEKTLKEMVHNKIIREEKRPDGRKLNELRPLFSQVNILPRVHGSALFFRGGTHILSVVTLGAPGDVQFIEGMEIQTKKRFLHHYNFPPFSTGETGRMAGPGRREIGHGALAERALLAVIPSRDEFPYTIRVVSECMASNGSTSMGSICASSLALMNAGVPIKAPVCGIAMGLMKDGEDYKILTDIQGPEDHQGDTDCKIAGTKDGVTAIQMDVKIEGVTPKILKEMLEQAREARMQILDNMTKTLAGPAKELPPQAPRIIKLKINPDKIREVIGPGGKTINKITEATGVEMDIEQDGTIFITGKNEKDAARAAEIVKEITHEYQVGEILKGIVTRIFDFGAMVEFAPKQEGLVHISELAPFRVNKVTDIVQIGDIIPIKIVGIDELGRFNLSLKAVDPNYARGKISTIRPAARPADRPAKPRPRIPGRRR